jgi:hypothetical protein
VTAHKKSGCSVPYNLREYPASSPRDPSLSKFVEDFSQSKMLETDSERLWKEFDLSLCRFQSRWNGRDEPLRTQETRGEATEAEGQW